MAKTALDVFLITRRWRDTDDGLRFDLWGQSNVGPVHLVFTRQRANFFVERHVPTVSGTRREVALKSFAGRDVDAVYFLSQRALRREREAVRADVRQTLEADLKPVDRFLMERFITGSLRARGELIHRDGHFELRDPEVQKAEYRVALSSLSFDIETHGLEGELFSIACAGVGGDVVFLRRDADAGMDLGAHVRHLPDERSVIAAFLEHVAAADPDALLGWNVVEFDLAYLTRRAEALKLPFRLGRGGGRARVLPPSNDSSPSLCLMPGRVVLDGIASLKSATLSFERFSLEHVAQALLGRGKRIHHGGDPVTEIKRLYDDDPQGLVDYNLEDARLVLDIFKRAHLFDFLIERQHLTGLPLDRQGGSVAAFDHLYLPRLHRHGVVAPDVGSSNKVPSSPGGMVLDSSPGLYENVLVLDFKSLYPSIVRTFRVDPLGLAFPGDDPVPGFDGGSFHRDTHILPGLLETLWRARDEAKRKQDVSLSRAIKILMNSFYGVLGTPGCRFFDPRLASSITRRGHEVIRESRTLVEARGLPVIYGDTDSIFVHAGERREQACLELGDALARSLNAHFRERLSEEFRLESFLEIEFETHYLRFHMPTLRGTSEGSKKRYAGLVRAKDGGTELVLKGLEAVRTDWTPLARRMQRELYQRVFTGRPHESWLRELRDKLYAGELDEELVYEKRLRRSLDSYQKNVPPHVQAARKVGRRVREIRYVITREGAEPADAPHAPLDYDHYEEKQLAPAANTLLRALDQSWQDVAGAQLALF